MAIKETLTQKIGPLPMWGWVSIVGGGVIVWAVYQRQKQGSTSSSAPTADNLTPPVIQQYQLSSPPTQVNVTDEGDGSDEDDPKKKKPKTPDHHHRRHHPRPHPGDHDHDRDDRHKRHRARA